MNYRLEIAAPDQTANYIAGFESDQPFGAIARGDLINPETFGDDPHPDAALIVTGVEHYVFEGRNRPMHRVRVFTTEQKDASGFRLRD